MFIFAVQQSELAVHINISPPYWASLSPTLYMWFLTIEFICSVQLLSRVWLFATLWIAARQASLSIPEFTQTHVHRVRDAIQPSHLCRPLLLLPPFPPSIRVFSNESALHMRWPKYWSFSFSIIPSKEHPGLISFRMDWLDPLAVQRTLKSLLQHHSSKASILRLNSLYSPNLMSIHDYWKNHSFD